MNSNPRFYIKLSLKNEVETIPVLAGRLAKFMTSLTKIDPLLTQWYTMTGGSRVDILAPAQASVEKAMSWWSNREKNPGAYSFIEVRNTNRDGPWRPEDVAIMLAAGLPSRNHLRFQTGYRVRPAPRLVNYMVFKQTMLAVADAFAVVYGFGGPVALDSNFGCPDFNKRPISASWMILLPQDLASQITPPPQAITQTRGDGSLFMAATDETFDVTNPAHLTVCKAMMEAVEPINRWELFKTRGAGQRASG